MNPIPQTHVSTPQGFNVQSPLQSTQDTESVISILPATIQLIGAVKPDGTTIQVTADGTISATSVPGGVTAVTGSAPIASTGGTTPNISVAAATTGALGVVRPDGTTITISGGVISAASVPGGVTAVTGSAPIASTGGTTPNISVAAATTGALGVVRPDGTTITISGGVISAASVPGGVTAVTGSAPIASTGGTTPDISVAAATTGALGVVRPDGTTITISGGVISAANLGTVTAVTGSAPIASTGGSTPAISVATATTGALGVVRPDGTTITISGGIISAVNPATNTQTIASGTAALGTSLIASGAAATVVTVSASGVLATDNIMADFNADPTSTTGYEPSTGGMLTIIKYPTTNAVNFKVVNNTGASITPGAVTLNWRVVR